MRFVFDEVLSSDVDSPEFEETCSTTSSVSSGYPTPEPSPATKLPLFTAGGAKELVVKFDPALEDLLRDLNLQSKLIPLNEPIGAAPSIMVPHPTNLSLPNPPRLSLISTVKTPDMGAPLLEAIEDSFQRKMQNLVLINQKEVHSKISSKKVCRKCKLQEKI